MEKGYEALRSYPSPSSDDLRFTPNPTYEQYLRIHKVLVGPKTAPVLEKIADSLGQETMPRYLVAAGWAAAEASLAQPHLSTLRRNDLLDQAEHHWLNALDTQRQLTLSDKEYLIEATAPFRTALDVARLPLLRGLIAGSITPTLHSSVRQETLMIANANIVQSKLALLEQDIESFNDHLGFGYECNSLIALDSLGSTSLFGMASFARSDSGHHHPEQTHDIVVFQQKNGLIQSMTPLEIKSTVSQRDRSRYRALLVRGKMHLSLPGQYSPEHTTRAFTALFEGGQTSREKEITDKVRKTLIDMFWQYKYGAVLADIATSRSCLSFRDRSRLHEKYPEIAVA